MCKSKERTHKHHIIPRYMGGTDVAENLVEITVTQHAMFHFCNYQLWNNEEDKIAWKMLSGQISVDEAKYQAMLLGGKKGRETQKEKLKDPKNLIVYIEKCRESFYNSPHKDEIIQKLKGNQPKAVEAARTPEAIEKKKKKLKEVEHQKGEKNSQYGTMWITDGTKKGSYRIKKGDPIPEGFRRGRTLYDENQKEELFYKYVYTIVTPEGETIITKSLTDYCKNNNLNQRTMSALVLGKLKCYKGYKITRKEL
jgi:hypothetical protein